MPTCVFPLPDTTATFETAIAPPGPVKDTSPVVNVAVSMASLNVNRALSIAFPVPEKAWAVTRGPVVSAKVVVAVYWSSVASPLVPSPSWFIGFPAVSLMFGPMTIVYVPRADWLAKVTSNWVLLVPETTTTFETVIAPAGPVNDTSAVVNVDVLIDSSNVKRALSMAFPVPEKACAVTFGPDVSGTGMLWVAVYWSWVASPLVPSPS